MDGITFFHQATFLEIIANPICNSCRGNRIECCSRLLVLQRVLHMLDDRYRPIYTYSLKIKKALFLQDLGYVTRLSLEF